MLKGGGEGDNIISQCGPSYNDRTGVHVKRGMHCFPSIRYFMKCEISRYLHATSVQRTIWRAFPVLSSSLRWSRVSLLRNSGYSDALIMLLLAGPIHTSLGTLRSDCDVMTTLRSATLA